MFRGGRGGRGGRDTRRPAPTRLRSIIVRKILDDGAGHDRCEEICARERPAFSLATQLQTCPL